jgi:hypothetical protein
MPVDYSVSPLRATDLGPSTPCGRDRSVDRRRHAANRGSDLKCDRSSRTRALFSRQVPGSSHLTRGQMQTYDLAELGRYYRHYRNLMMHSHRVLSPGRIIDVRYEDLAADFEGVARHLVECCGLKCDTRCLDLHRTERAIRTASAMHVRRPAYRSSIGRWRKCEALLGPLLAELEA